jgi:hypothetical protein
MSKDIFTPDKEHAAARENYALIDALYMNAENFRASGYVKKRPRENQDDFAYRLANTYVPAGVPETVIQSLGKLFEKSESVTLGQDAPQAIVEYAENIDGRGNSMQVFASDMAADILKYGCSIVFVDYGNIEKYKTDFLYAHGRLPNADEIPSDINRPYVVLYSPSQVLGGKQQWLGGKYVMTELRLQSGGNVRLFSLEGGVFSISEYERTEGGEIKQLGDTVYPTDISGKNLAEIPIIISYASKLSIAGIGASVPPLLRLAENTVKLVNAESCLDALINITQVAILLIKTDDEMPKDALAVGEQAGVTMSSASDMKYVEASGSAANLGVQQVERIRGEREQLGLNSLLTRQPGGIAATTAALATMQANSQLHAIAIALKDALERIIQAFGVYLGLGIDGGGSVSYSPELRPLQDGTAATNVLALLLASGIIDTKTAIEIAARRVPELEGIDSNEVYGRLTLM